MTTPSTVEKPHDAALASEDQRKAPEPPRPTWFETVQSALPAHTYVSRSGQTWRADWSTPVGLWTVNRTTGLMQKPQIKIVGPWHTAEFQDAPATFVVELLHTFGAIA